MTKIKEGYEQCSNCQKIVKNEKIYQTHENGDEPENKTYCEEC